MGVYIRRCADVSTYRLALFLSPLMKKFNVYLEDETLRKLRVISDVSLGKPDVSSLIRHAIDSFVLEQRRANPAIQRALNRDTTPRLVKTGTGQHPFGSGADDSRPE